MKRERLLELLKKTGALLEGHFLLSSGLHSDMYIQCAKLLQYPDIAEEVGRELALKFVHDGLPAADLVASPALGGLIIGHEVARALNVRHIFVEKDSEGKPTLRRGFDIHRGEKFIVIEDVVTTGKSSREVIDVLQAIGGKPVAICAIVDRSSGRELPFGGIPLIALEKFTIATYTPKECPLCARGIEVVKPGSRKQ